jgi:hypothetical protein
MEKLHQAANFHEFQWNHLLSSFNCFLFEIRGRKRPASGLSAIAEDPLGGGLQGDPRNRQKGRGQWQGRSRGVLEWTVVNLAQGWAFLGVVGARQSHRPTSSFGASRSMGGYRWRRAIRG